MLPGLDRSVEAGADLLVAILAGEERRLRPEDAIRWMLLSLSDGERLSEPMERLVRDTLHRLRDQGQTGSPHLLELSKRLGDRHPEVVRAIHELCYSRGQPGGFTRGAPVISIRLSAQGGGIPPVWRAPGAPVEEIQGDGTVTIGPYGGGDADLVWDAPHHLTLELGSPAAWSPTRFALRRGGAPLEVLATPLFHGDQLRCGPVVLTVDRRPLEERAAAAVADIPDLASRVPGALHPAVLELCVEAARHPRQPERPDVDGLLERAMDDPLRVLLLLRRHFAYGRIHARGVTLGSIDPRVPVYSKDGRGPHADTYVSGTLPDAFRFGRDGRGDWVFVVSPSHVRFLRTQDARGYGSGATPAPLLGVT